MKRLYELTKFEDPLDFEGRWKTRNFNEIEFEARQDDKLWKAAKRKDESDEE